MVNAVFTIIGLAVLTLVGWFTREFFLSAEISLFIRVLAGIIITGGLFLMIVVIKDRIKQLKKENFRGVEK